MKDTQGKRKPALWIDLDNTPHIVFFEPIVDELRARGFPMVITARDAFQVCELADQKRIPYRRIDRHLQQTGRLVLIESAEDVARKLRLEKRSRQTVSTSRKTLDHIVDTVEGLIGKLQAKQR